jgi:hypothetical protein
MDEKCVKLSAPTFFSDDTVLLDGVNVLVSGIKDDFLASPKCHGFILGIVANCQGIIVNHFRTLL